MNIKNKLKKTLQFSLILSSVLVANTSFAKKIKVVNPKIEINSQLSSPVVLENTSEKNYLRVSLKGFDIIEKSDRKPINLAIVIDRSGSMSGDKIKKARQAAILAVNLLNKTDIISVIGYDDSAEVIISATKVNNKKELIKKIKSNIQASGSTALFAGVSKGIKEVKKFIDDNQINRVILLSDGQANIGPSSTSELAELGKLAGKKGIAVTTIGLGVGYNENLMAAIANYSDGNHIFVENSKDLETAFNKEFKDAMSIVAQNIEIIINLKGDVKPVRLLGYDGEIIGQKVIVKMNQIYANQEKYVLLEVIPEKGKNNAEKSLADINISYKNMQTLEKQKENQLVSIKYTKSKQKVKETIVEDVLVQSVIQKSNIQNYAAKKALEKGDKNAAMKILNEKKESLEVYKESFSSSSALDKIQSVVVEDEASLQDIESKSIEYNKKSIKQKSFNLKKSGK